MSLLISGVFDGPLPGGLPKGVELYVTADVADLSIFGIGSANNGGGSDGEEFTLSGSAAAGDFIYITTNATAFETFFGFAPTFEESTASNINGDDAIELFENGVVIDVFGDINVDGTGEPWEHLDGWAYTNSDRMPSDTFDPADWSFSGPNALDNETTNDTAATPFPVGSFATVVTPPMGDATFTLELLHFTDQEANAATIDNIDNLSAVLNALREQDLGMDGEADNTLTLSAGDAIIPGLFFDASEAVFGSQGIADIQIQNELGVEAIALGNHEFDLGTGLLAGLIGGSAPGDFTVAELDGTALEDLDFTGAAFPYLSANLDFSTDQNFDGLEVAGLQAPIANKVTSSVVLEEGGELIGVVGATVPTIRSISSPGDDLGISPAWASGSPTDAELDALAVILQAEVDDLLTANPAMNKVILASHMQQISIELALAERLENVDIIIAGGSNTRLFDDNDRVRDGDSDQGQYPAFVTNAGGTTTAVVNTDGNYKYVGRLVIDFDADGNIIADSYDETVSGAYATDDQGVADLNAAALVDPEVDAITDAIQAQIVATESNVFGVSDVFLNGNRSGTFAADDPDGVRTQETNLGNLTADANLAYANDMIAEQGLGDPVVVSIKNGGGIRANIGQIVVPAGGTEAERVPNEEILDSAGDVVKPAGGISQNDIATTLAFNNGLTLVDMTKTELRDFLEGAISALPVGVSGGFPQLSGLHFSFDETQTAQTYDVDGNIATPGERVVDAGIFAEDGTLIAEIVRDGEIVGDPSETFRVVTLNFLANAGDEILSTLSNPNRVDLIDLDADGESDDSFTGDAVFATDGSEQDALAEYLNDNFNPDNGGVAFSEADVGPDTDARIQNLTFRESDILEDLPGGPVVAPVATEELGEITEAVVLDSGVGEGSSEVVVYDSGRVYTTNGVAGGIDVWDPASGSQVDFYDLTFLPGFASVQSVAVKDGLAVAAVSTPDVADGGEVLGQNGYIVLIDTATGNVIDRVTVGNLPDMVTFNSDGLLVLVANEGEFNSEGDVTVDPAGSVSIVDVSNGALDPVGEEIDFSDLVALAEEKGIRLFPGISALTDLEPEYITVAGDTAYVALQEANAIAVLDIPTKTFTDIFSAGVVDHSQAGNELDANDDDIIDIRTFDNLVGLRMPDAISSFEKDGATYIITANEGDGRGDAPEGDEARVGDIIAGEVDGLSIDAAVDTTGLERLTVSTIDGDTDGDGDIDVLHAFGSRSFTIFDTDGNVVFDSGSQFEAIIAAVAPERFNDDDGDAGQNRSDAKGPEPEAVITGVVNGVLYAFIGLERDSGIMIYNIDNPASAFFVDYIPGFGGESGDHIAPETIAFIPADESASGVAQIAVAYEVSGETIVYDLGEVGDIGGTDPILINEFQPNPDGGDPADAAIELKGTPGTDFDVWLFSVESDPGNPGVVDRAENVTGTFDANGLAVVTVPDLENPSFTYVLATDFTGTVGDTDLDTDDDGVADDLSTVGDVLDAIGVPDAAGEPLYATQLGGTDLANVGTTEPSLTFRDGETGEIYSIFGGTVFDAAGNEVDAAEFDKDPTQTTFGDINPIRTGAQPDLQITEIWPGQDGTDVTADWFEITNVGSGAFNTGTLFYDDESADINDATQIIGIDTLAPGESAIVVIGNMGDATEFETVWGDDVDLTGVQVGFTDGSGLGGGGDAVNLYLDTDDTLTDDDLVDNEAYPDTDGNSGRSWDVANAQFSNVGALTNVVATDDLGGENDDEPAIASPGSLTDPIVVAPTPDVVINEYRISSAGDADDTSNFVELFTTPGASFDGLTLLVLSGEFNPGEINNAISLDGAVADENGFLLIANSANPELGDGDVGVADLDFFGSPTVFKVVDGFTGTEGGDLDGDNDGTLDTMPWTAELASLALIDGDGTADQTFGAADTLGPDGDFTPAAAARDVDGTGDFQILAFGDDSADTPGATNVIDPGTGDAVTIMEIQGAAHTSPLLDQTVATSGIVTAVDTNGFYVQDPDGDGDIATSDAIFVFTSSTPTVSVGDAVEITGTVSEFFPGGEDTGNLSTTQISGSPQVTVTSSNNALPTATILGAAGRAVPTENIDDDAFASFDPTTDGIDFFESLEAMLVTVDDPLAIAPTNRFGETFVVADNGAGATGLSERGTLNISPDDFNPEKIQIDPDSGILDISLETNVGATFQDISGVIGYSFGNFEVIPTEVVVTIDTPFPETEVAEIAGTEDQLTIASYNVL
ncbi:MAG: choice-of-anchor I family protein, partial [Pseudomonadota bacterium]